MRWNYLSIPKLQVWEQMSDFITHDIVMGVIFFIHSGIQLTFYHISIRGPRTSLVGNYYIIITPCVNPDSKVHVANMGPTWVLSAPGGSHVGPMNLANRELTRPIESCWYYWYSISQWIYTWAVFCRSLLWFGTSLFFPYTPQSLNRYWDDRRIALDHKATLNNIGQYIGWTQ